MIKVRATMKTYRTGCLVILVILLSGCSGDPLDMNNSAMLSGKSEDFLKNPLQSPGQVKKEDVQIPLKPDVDFWPEEARFIMREIQFEKIIDAEIFEGDKGTQYRLLGIDSNGDATQEKRKYVELNAEAASNYLASLLIDRKLYIEIPPGLEGEQPIPVYVWTGDNEKMVNINARMIEQGFSIAYRENSYTLYDRTFKSLEVEAKKEGRGIWKNSEYIN